MILAVLRRIPVWAWLILAILVAAGVSHAVQERRIAELRREVDTGREEMAQAASAAVEATLAVLDSRAKSIESRLQGLDARGRETDQWLAASRAQTAQTREAFTKLAETGTAAEIVERARLLGYTAIPAPRPR